MAKKGLGSSHSRGLAHLHFKGLQQLDHTIRPMCDILPILSGRVCVKTSLCCEGAALSRGMDSPLLVPLPTGPWVCVCCGGAGLARSKTRRCNQNQYSPPHPHIIPSHASQSHRVCQVLLKDPMHYSRSITVINLHGC